MRAEEIILQGNKKWGEEGCPHLEHDAFQELEVLQHIVAVRVSGD